jgi:HD-GYP domain-containing protein (c-di-GMP phosphodiesterase class II)
MAPQHAMQLLVKVVGSQFDPKIFTHFKTAFEQGRLTLPPDVPTQLMVD